jgi:hypothetical protein
MGIRGLPTLIKGMEGELAHGLKNHTVHLDLLGLYFGLIHSLTYNYIVKKITKDTKNILSKRDRHVSVAESVNPTVPPKTNAIPDMSERLKQDTPLDMFIGDDGRVTNIPPAQNDPTDKIVSEYDIAPSLSLSPTHHHHHRIDISCNTLLIYSLPKQKIAI